MNANRQPFRWFQPLAAILLLTTGLSQFAFAQGEIEVSAEQLNEFHESPIVLTGTLTAARAGATNFSLPPIFHYSLDVDVDAHYKGDVGTGMLEGAHYSISQDVPPALPLHQSVVVFARRVGDDLVVDDIRCTDDGTAELLQILKTVPVGWSVNEHGKPVSPWPHQKGTDWDALEYEGFPPKCAVTDRPAVVLPESIRMTVEPVPPDRKIKWTNPDGDGQYTVTLTNPTDAPVVLNSLVSDGEQILWNECLLVRCQGTTYSLHSSATPMPNAVAPVTLAPGQSVSAVVNALSLEGPRWPRGGSRVEFQFVIGNTSVVQSFYYYSDHHDAIRDSIPEASRNTPASPPNQHRN